MNIDSINLKATVDGIEYHWCGYIGYILCSYEKNVNMGDTRMIGDIKFKVHNIQYKVPDIYCVNWGLCGAYHTGYVREIKRALFGL